MKTTHQKRVMQILEQQTDWISVAQLSALTGIAEPNMRNILRQKSFDFLERGVLDTGRPHGGKFVRVYRISRKAKTVDDAIHLAKQHTGVFGQLFWTNNKKVEVIV